LPQNRNMKPETLWFHRLHYFKQMNVGRNQLSYMYQGNLRLLYPQIALHSEIIFRIDHWIADKQDTSRLFKWAASRCNEYSFFSTNVYRCIVFFSTNVYSLFKKATLVQVMFNQSANAVLNSQNKRHEKG
jgi:hypothetical protein